MAQSTGAEVGVSAVAREIRRRGKIGETTTAAPTTNVTITPKHVNMTARELFSLLFSILFLLGRGRASRWVHPASGRSYNIFSNPPKVAGKDDVSHESPYRPSSSGCLQQQESLVRSPEMMQKLAVVSFPRLPFVRGPVCLLFAVYSVGSCRWGHLFACLN